MVICLHNKKKKRRKKPKADDHRLTIAVQTGVHQCHPICWHSPFLGELGCHSTVPSLHGQWGCLSPLGCSGPPVCPPGAPSCCPWSLGSGEPAKCSPHHGDGMESSSWCWGNWGELCWASGTITSPLVSTMAHSHPSALGVRNGVEQFLIQEKYI